MGCPRALRPLLALFIFAACTASLCSCSDDLPELSEGAAASVGGVEIMESEVTALVESTLSGYGIAGEGELANFMIEGGYYCEDMRSDALRYLIDGQLVRLAAEEKGVVLDEAAIDSYIRATQEAYGVGDGWAEFLASSGMTEEGFRYGVEVNYLQEELTSLFEGAQPSTEDVLEAARAHISYFDGAKRVSRIVLSSDDGELAERLASQLRAGEIDFDAAIAQYSLEASGANLGWNVLSSDMFVYSDVLAALGAGDISEPLAVEDGIHVLLCEEAFAAPDDLASLDELPAEFVDVFERILESEAQRFAYEEWMSEFRETVDIVYASVVVEELPYYVDLSEYEYPSEVLQGK